MHGAPAVGRELRVLAAAIVASIVIAPAHAASIAAGGWHALALDAAGTARSWGRDTYGQLGLGRLGGSALPVRVAGISSIKAADTGGLHIVALADDGSVWSWGDGSQYLLGDGSSLGRAHAAQVNGLPPAMSIDASSYRAVVAGSDGTVWTWGQTLDWARPSRVEGYSGIASVAAGREHVLAIDAGAAVWASGSNTWGQLGRGTLSDGLANAPAAVPGATGAVAVAGGSDSSFALRADGVMLAWGHNMFGQLGDGTVSNSPRGQPMPVAGATDVVAVAAGGETPFGGHTVAIKRDRTLIAWGSNFSGQLGSGTTSIAPVTRPIAVAGIAEAEGRAGISWVCEA